MKLLKSGNNQDNKKLKWVMDMKKMKTCGFCGSMRIKGLYVLSQWMCSECEEKLLQSSSEDPDYEDNVNKVKNAWKSHCLVNKK
ncbi:sigma factor G inhibitor Gin [Irregularibacter muris]|uniref:Sigma factor G inhibitor Gin n=1 Tax=Irregularibacter muris TaxID=1796619 RepID=A0AAE3HHJ3_9FIRM|nr:sigma factor G inhibitor Gin [Irregularibacter muris]MCR1899544.1 sigma factor G inhibitor Gin [Irregularibacter muris]